MMTDEKAATGKPHGGGDLIWITEAIVEYKRSRGWFAARLEDGRLHQSPQLGTNRVYLHRSEIERLIREESR